ncbi:hypothetical protein [Acinetobacter pittii]|uniref:hypothetical protein n=1 Tax=Acinetobacter pittii TaxID=48296 RepID=UPI0026E0080E|nr:hypothetical protein [Acinetobacter pittii]
MNKTKGCLIANFATVPCLEIKSKHGFFKDTGDGQYIESIQPCSKKGLATPKVTR